LEASKVRVKTAYAAGSVTDIAGRADEEPHLDGVVELTFTGDLAKLAFEQGTKALSAQVATVDNVRTRFGVLLGGGNVATAFLGKDAITRGLPAGGPMDPAFGLGIIAFVVFVLACMYGLVPRGGWTFDLSAETILERGQADSDGMPTIEDVHENLARWSEYYFGENTARLNKLYWAMILAIAALVVEFVAFFVVVLQ
jgi:hypothetical protein